MAPKEPGTYPGSDADQFSRRLRCQLRSNQRFASCSIAQHQPTLLFKIKISSDSGAIPFISKMAFLDWNANGVGPKTAAIVLCFSLGRPAFPVDTHVYRVTGRIGLRPLQMSVEEAHPYFEALLPPETFYAAHLNIIRLGREICHARKPTCAICPLRDVCDYAKHQLE